MLEGTYINWRYEQHAANMQTNPNTTVIGVKFIHACGSITIISFFLLGDSRNIQRVFVAGRDVTPSASSAIKPVVPVIVLCMIQLVLAVLY